MDIAKITMTQCYKTKQIKQWLEGHSSSDEVLIKAATEIQEGLYEASLGSEVIKKRIAFPGKGKSGSGRTLVAFRSGTRLIFIHGFDKNEMDNIPEKELILIRKMSKFLLSLSENEFSERITTGQLIALRGNEDD